jgi:hypothetical protein
VVWGLTASVLVETAEVAFGRKAAFRKNPPGEGGTDIQSIRATPGDLEDDAAKEAPRPRESKKKTAETSRPGCDARRAKECVF